MLPRSRVGAAQNEIAAMVLLVPVSHGPHAHAVIWAVLLAAAAAAVAVAGLRLLLLVVLLLLPTWLHTHCLLLLVLWV